MAGNLTRIAYQYYADRLTDVLPALGTHRRMTPAETTKMFGDVPATLFREHNYRTDVVTPGTVPSSYIQELSEGKLDYDWPAQVNKLVRDGGHDLVLSIGQVVPHEVIGMANYNKIIFVGTGGRVGRWNTVEGEEIFFVSNPGLGLCAYRDGLAATSV